MDFIGLRVKRVGHGSLARSNSSRLVCHAENLATVGSADAQDTNV